MAYDEDIPNLALIYDGPDHLPWPPAPLILLHDGGGTTFSYHCMDPTNRPLYGIHNAHFDEGGWWDGGIPEMAKHYIGLISRALPSGGNIILGGWSLGGLLSLEMASQIAADPSMVPNFRVLGIVMVDSVCPFYIARYPELVRQMPKERIHKSDEELKAMKLKEKVDLSMTHARVMIQKWEQPTWHLKAPPPTILLRAKEAVNPEHTSFVDHSRNETMLGWRQYNEENGSFIREIVDIEGHHFSIFEEQHITNVSAKICAAADSLERSRYYRSHAR